MDYEFDKVDFEILYFLAENAKTPYTEIAKKLYVSPGTIHSRVSKMEKARVIKGSTLIIDPATLGYDLTAFLGIYLDKGASYPSVIRELKRIPEVIEAHYTTGNYSVFIKLVCKNTKHLRAVLGEKIQAIQSIERTETILSLEESIKRSVTF